jgi:hypothetical protein
VTARVVDALEVVDVDDHHGERAALAACVGQLPAQDLLEAAVVGQAGEGIAVGQLLQALVVLLEIDGHGIEVTRELAELILAPPAQARAQIARAHGLSGQAQLVQGTKYAASQHHCGEDREREQQKTQHERDPLVAVPEQLVGGTQVVAGGERPHHPAIVLEWRDQHLGVPVLVAHLGRPSLALVHGRHGQIALHCACGLLSGRDESVAAARSVDRNGVKLGMGYEERTDLAPQHLLGIEHPGLAAAVEGRRGHLEDVARRVAIRAAQLIARALAGHICACGGRDRQCDAYLEAEATKRLP